MPTRNELETHLDCINGILYMKEDRALTKVDLSRYDFQALEEAKDLFEKALANLEKENATTDRN